MIAGPTERAKAWLLCSLALRSMCHQKFNDRHWIIEPVHMTDSGFHNHLDATAHCLVALFQNPRVLLDRNNCIRTTHHVQQRHASFCQRFEVVDRTAAVSERFAYIAKAV